MPTTGPGSPAALRQANLARVIAAISAGGDGVTQAEIARRSGLSAATVTNLVRRLEQDGQVTVRSELRAGRRSRVVIPAAVPGFVLGFDLGRTHIRAGLATTGHRLVIQRHWVMPPETSAADGLARCAAMRDDLLRQTSLRRGDIKAVAAGVPGPLDSASGEIGAGAILPEWTGINLEERFSAALDFPVTVENDANLGALGEFIWGQAERVMAPQVYVRLTTGIGCGIVIDGYRLWRGAAGTAGELGHISLDSTGRLCRCGNRGCLETTASTPVLLENLSAALERSVTLPEWLAMAGHGQNASVRLLEDMGRNVGTAIATLVNLLSPAVVVVGGPVTAGGDLLLAPMRETVVRRSMPAPGRAVRLRLPRHPGMTELHGALALAAEGARLAFTS
ncbi:MAG: ROK family transcriptional regulator [Bifidobacteriaceae bacterium]|jgi:predicted NBD/HSP70 family sugar kinase/DNA-binding CsgD family transcriptional regulator|nr:ROK family transcriptional regulator [Bifidobacteriaceae bacterium]